MQKFLRSLFVLLFLVIVCGTIRANNPPANDSVNNAIDLGLLPMPGPCPNSPDGDTISFFGTTDFATFNPLDFSITHCYTSGSPDVWYKFHGTGSHTYFEMVGFNGLNNFFIKLHHSQGSCLSLVPLECVTSSLGTIIYSFPTPAINGEYYIQIGGGNNSQTGNFHLKMKSYEDCNGCVKHGNVMMDPAPTFGRYNIGDTVSMCTTVAHWDALSTSYLHGIVPEFADDWDTLSLIATQAPISPSNSQNWHWFTNIATPNGTHSGFFYDANGNGDPTDNRGDNGNALTSWTGCWKIKTKPQCITNDLSVDIHIYSDAETGNGNPAFVCDQYDAIHISTAMNCCQSPTVVVNTNGGCATGVSSINVHAGGASYFTDSCNYFLLDTSMNIVQQTTNVVGPTNFLNVIPGQYIVWVVDVTTGGCNEFQTVTVNPGMVLNVRQTSISCQPGMATAIVEVVSGGSGQYTYNWLNVLLVNQNDSVASSLSDGWVSVSVFDQANGCTSTDSVFIISETMPDATFDLPPGPICSMSDTIVLSMQPISPGGIFNLVSPLASGIIVDSITGEILLNNTSHITPFYVYEKYTVGINCQSSFIDSILVVAPPAVPIATSATGFTYCIGSSPPVFSVSVPQTTIAVWYDVFTGGSGIGNTYTPQLSSSTAPGTYLYGVASVLSLNSGCSSPPIYFIVTAVAPPAITVGNDTTICIGQMASLDAFGCSCNYLWNPIPTNGPDNTNNSLTSPSSTTTYTVVATDQNGCSDYANQTVTVDQSGLCELHVYTGLTPNSDGHNDAWIIDGLDNSTDINVTIFNRWGDEVWKGENYDNTTVLWHGEDKSGKALPDATYYYIITSKDNKMHGWVELSH